MFKFDRGIQEPRGLDSLTDLFFYTVNFTEQAHRVIPVALIPVIVNGVIVFHNPVNRSFGGAHNLKAFLDKEALLVCGTHAFEIFREFLNNRAELTVVHTS
jgi:hypothetical protein